MKNSKGLFIKDPNYWRMPRKQKKKIPKNTMYCYTPLTKPGYMEDGRWGYKIKPCEFYTWIKYKDMEPKPGWMDKEWLDEYGEKEDSWCKLIKADILDQCKSCGSRYPKYFE